MLAKWVNKPWRTVALAGLALSAFLVWSYEPALMEIVSRWTHDPQYSHGYLVPLFAGFLLWQRRERLAGQPVSPAWWGLLVVLAGVAMRLAGAYLYIDWLVGLSLLPTLAGLVLLIGGLPVLRWAWPAVAFLFFMVPLPFRFHAILGGPLQHLATVASTYALQTLGFPALSEGNVILIDQTRIGVAEACSGLSMMITFLALSTAVVLAIDRPLTDRIVLLASAVPVAVACNLVRITVTGMLHEVAGSRIADLVFHDLAGWLMMPLAVAILFGELHLLSRLFVPVSSDAPVPLAQPGTIRKAQTTVRGQRKAKSAAVAVAPTTLEK